MPLFAPSLQLCIAQAASQKPWSQLAHTRVTTTKGAVHWSLPESGLVTTRALTAWQLTLLVLHLHLRMACKQAAAAAAAAHAGLLSLSCLSPHTSQSACLQTLGMWPPQPCP